jgi:hypothetical protein
MSMGVNATWDLLNELTQAVPFFKRVVELVEQLFCLKHSTKHILPDPEKDIAGLMRTFRNVRIFDYRDDRKDLLGKYTPPKDVFLLGSSTMQDTEYLEELFDERWIYLSHARTDEDFSLPPAACSDLSDSVNQESNNASLGSHEEVSQEMNVVDENSPLRVFPEEEDNEASIEHTTLTCSSMKVLSARFFHSTVVCNLQLKKYILTTALVMEMGVRVCIHPGQVSYKSRYLELNNTIKTRTSNNTIM